MTDIKEIRVNTEDKTIRTRSYTAASSIPIKTALNRELERHIINFNRIPPIHIQMNPTNECNLNCDFCSCSGRKKNGILPLKKARHIITKLAFAGAKAVTVTGGGEPLLYPQINDLINEFLYNRILIGLVTNGTQFNNIDPIQLNKVTWCRISHSDKRQFNAAYAKYLDDVVNSCPDVDWAFSIVVSGEYDKELLCNVGKAVQFANDHNFTHVRIVPDLFNTEFIDLDIYRDFLPSVTSDGRVIYQERDNATRGGECYICYLKPYIDVDGKIYTCCGAQYALPGEYRFMPPELCLGTIDEFLDMLKKCKPFNGSICQTCYYMGYNELLKSMLQELDHKDFL